MAVYLQKCVVYLCTGGLAYICIPASQHACVTCIYTVLVCELSSAIDMNRGERREEGWSREIRRGVVKAAYKRVSLN